VIKGTRREGLTEPIWIGKKDQAKGLYRLGVSEENLTFYGGGFEEENTKKKWGRIFRKPGPIGSRAVRNRV